MFKLCVRLILPCRS